MKIKKTIKMTLLLLAICFVLSGCNMFKNDEDSDQTEQPITEVFEGGVDILSLVVLTDHSSQIKWSRYSGPGFKAYLVYRNTNGSVSINNSTKITTINQSNISEFTDNNLQSSSTYYYKVMVLTTNNQIIHSTNTMNITTPAEMGQWYVTNTIGLSSIDMLNPSFGYAVGSNKTYFFNGTSWTQENTVGDSDVKVISSTCVYTPTRFFNGSTWTNLPSERRGYSVTGTDANHIWIGDSYGEIHFYNGNSWETSDLDYSTIYSIDAYSDLLVYAIDSNGKIIKHNGVGWSQVSDLLLSSSNNNPKIKVINSSEFWVVCDKKIYKFLNNQLNNTWTMSENVYCVEGTASNNIWFGGANGKIWYYDGTNLIPTTTSCTFSIYDIKMFSNSLGLAVGSGGILKYQ